MIAVILVFHQKIHSLSHKDMAMNGDDVLLFSLIDNWFALVPFQTDLCESKKYSHLS